ncbi:type IV pilus assembly protein PilY1 [Oxalobacteraceae bacterium GrIS 2.11]
MNKYIIRMVVCIGASALLPLTAHAQKVVSENFNGTAVTNQWIALNGACMTASTLYTDSTSLATLTDTSSGNFGQIPGCAAKAGGGASAGNVYYKNIGSNLVGGYLGAHLPDSKDQGVLRLTNGADSSMSSGNGNNQTGAIISALAFPSSQGLHITFNTFTWGGNAYSGPYSAQSGADGMAFFLLDAAKIDPQDTENIIPNFPTAKKDGKTVFKVTSTGSYGGSLGYDCASNKYSASNPIAGDGFAHAYLGLGIDEYGNFANKGDNGNANDVNSPGTLPNAISIRGAGNITANRFPNANTLGPITTAKYVCQFGYYTTSATSSVPVTTATISGSHALNDVISATANAAAPDTDGTATVTWVSQVYSSSSSQTTTGTYPVTGVFDYPLMAVKCLSPGTTATSGCKKNPVTNPLYNQEYASAPQRHAAIPISYTLDLTSAGLLSISYAYNGGLSSNIMVNVPITGTNKTGSIFNGNLPDYFLFGFSSGTGGGSNNHEISCFKASQIVQSSSSSGGNVPQNTQIKNGQGDQIYLASFNPLFWTGSLTASPLYVDTITGAVSVQTATWDASCVLTGGVCDTTGKTVTQKSNRAIATWNNTTKTGIPFQYASLSTTQKAEFDCGSTTSPVFGQPNSTCDTLGPDRVSYVRGTLGATTITADSFRTRRSLLGDIVNSSPIWLGPPLSPYGNQFKDMIHTTAQDPVPEQATYGSFATTLANANTAGRLNMVYVGGNDGMIHGFAAGTGTPPIFDPTYNTGVEVMAFIPSLATDTLHNLVYSNGGDLDFTGINYAHNDYVDATPGTGDLYYGNNWHTWLVGGLGGGGNAGGVIGATLDTGANIVNDTATNGLGEIYAIDITNPTYPTSSSATGMTDASAATAVMGDWNTNTITCINVANCGAYMGSSYGTPVVRRLHSGNWAIIFGNGIHSANGTAGIFVIEIVNSSTSTCSTCTLTPPTYKVNYYDTGVGALTMGSGATAKTYNNGITYVTPVDLDGDHIVDYVYAGDLLGNVWRFDLTSNLNTSWGSPVSIFNASTSSVLAPITSAVTVNSFSYNGSYAVLIDFGTGREVPQTLTSGIGFTAAAQTLYGIWDWNMGAWNALNSKQYYSLTNGPSGGITTSNLTVQTLSAKISLSPDTTINSSGASFGYTNSNNLVCFSFVAGCTGSPSTSYGWYLNLPNQQEQIIYNPVVEDGTFFVNSVIPGDLEGATASCVAAKAGGYVYAINAATGGSTANIFGPSTGYNAGNLAAVQINGVGTPYFVTSVDANGKVITSMITQTQSGIPNIQAVNVNINSGNSSRLTWLELR